MAPMSTALNPAVRGMTPDMVPPTSFSPVASGPSVPGLAHSNAVVTRTPTASSLIVMVTITFEWRLQRRGVRRR